MNPRALVTLIFLGLMGGSFSYAATLGPVSFDCLGITCGTVDVLTNTDAGVQGDIFATFTGVPGLMAALTDFGGHLNWLNIVTDGTPRSTPQQDPAHPNRHVQFPFIDPMDRGNMGFGFETPADRLPFFYDEVGVAGGNPLMFQMAGDMLGFYDHPTNQAGVTWSFRTYLVLVPGDAGQTTNKTFAPLMGFKWTFTENAAGDGQEDITNLSLMPMNAGHINSINDALDDSPTNRFQSWKAISETTQTTRLGTLVIPVEDDPGPAATPEPGTVMMFLGGLGALVIAKRRRHAA